VHFLVLSAAALAVLQDPHAHTAPPAAASLDEVVKRPVAIRAGIGSAHDQGSSLAEAQAFYDQGLAHLHSYVWLEAARSFNQALRLDPKLSMAELGLTVAYTELNAPAAARAALDHARTGAPAASDHVRRHIAVRALQMAAEDAPRDLTRLAAYRAALDEALAKYPADEELWLQRGLAESADPAERGQGSVAGSVRFYQKALALAPGHFAAHHFLAHAYENTGRLGEALAEGTTYARMAPAVAHARHMHGHVLIRTGRMAGAIVEFEAADALESAYFTTEKIPVEFDWHYQHNLDLLAMAYQYVGQMAKAEVLFKRSFGISSSLVEQEINKRGWTGFLLARGRASEALDAATTLAGHRSPLVSAAGHVESGRARLALGQFRAAAEDGNTALRLMKSAPEGAGLVATPLQTLQGEFLLRTDQKDKGRPMLEEVAQRMRALPGPDNWTVALFTLESIARAAHEVGDWDLAGWAARQMRDHDPNYAGSHYALALVAEHQGDAATARSEFGQAATCWKNADRDLPELQRIGNRRE
jgi:tetratricopeptide (TPR) repeat protein